MGPSWAWYFHSPEFPPLLKEKMNFTEIDLNFSESDFYFTDIDTYFVLAWIPQILISLQWS